MNNSPKLSDYFTPKKSTQEKIIAQGSKFFVPTNKNRILQYLASGCSLASAFRMTRISTNTQQDWIERGIVEMQDYDAGRDETLKDYGQFLINMQAAMASHAYKMRMQTEYLVFQEKDARYAALLMRLMASEHPEVYAPKQRVEQKTDITVKYEFDELDGDDWDKRLLGQSKDESNTVEAEFNDSKIE